MNIHKDAFEEKTTLRIVPDENNCVGFIIKRGESTTIFIADAATFREITREMNTLTWSVHG